VASTLKETRHDFASSRHLTRVDTGVIDASTRGVARPMQPPARQSTRSHVALSGRVIASYRRLLSRLTGRSKRPASARSDIECMRMCVEAADAKRDAA
jgi:hypothetical protein